jgi:hypothetical protein
MAQGKKEYPVSVILRSSMDIPLFTHAKSKSSVNSYPIPPIDDPIVTVNAILECARNPRPEVVAGAGDQVMVWAYRLVPRFLEKYQGWRGVSPQLTIKPKPVEGDDNLFAPMSNTYMIRGEFGITREHLKAYPKPSPAKVALMVTIPVLLGVVLLCCGLAWLTEPGTLFAF